MTDIKTHREVKQPRLSDNKLADYMAASEQVRRGILRSCKYQRKTAIIQHHDAKKIISESLLSGKLDIDLLKKKLDHLEGKITDTPFEDEVKTHNVDYVNSVLTMGIKKINGVEFDICKQNMLLDFNGTEVSFFPNILVARTNKRNNRKIGAINLRYSKSSALPVKAADYQSSLVFGVLKEKPFEVESQPEKALCQTIDGFNGEVYYAPSNALYLYKEIVAACGAIAYQWPNIEPPDGAIF